jgi:hypothetical protein
MHWIDIIGGIMLLLLGLRYLRKGFARLFGGDLLDWLQATAHSRTRAFGAGAVAGAIMPSSTAMAFLSVQLTREGKAPWATVFALLLGIICRRLKPPLPARLEMAQLTGNGEFIRRRILGVLVIALGTTAPRQSEVATMREE